MFARLVPIVVLSLAPVLFAPQSPAVVTPARPAPPPTYNVTADAKAAIAASVHAAATDDIRVLVNWGANDCDSCTKYLAAQRSKDVAPRFFSDEYRQVFVNVGHLDANVALAKSYGVTLTADTLPALTVLDRNGKVVANVTSKQFSDQSGFNPELISAFLATHQAPQPNDTANFENAVKQAKRDGKTVLVWFSAPW